MDKKIECPSCGQIAMVKKKGSSKMADGIVIKKIDKWICENCAEELFDLKAMKEIRAQRERSSVAV